VYLACSRRCGGTLFRALFAEVDVDAAGEYQEHRIVQQSYVCLNCGAPALDLGAVPAEIDAERQADSGPAVVAEVLCPVCETRVVLDAAMECPNCGSPLEVG
jgi:hypothetical protein